MSAAKKSFQEFGPKTRSGFLRSVLRLVDSNLVEEYIALRVPVVNRLDTVDERSFIGNL